MTVDPFRLRVLKAVTAAIEAVNPTTEGFVYRHDLRGKVKRGRLIYGTDDPVPLVSILEPPIPLDVVRSRGDNPNSTGPWDLLIQGWATDDHDNPTDPAHALMAEVKRALIIEKQRDRGLNILGLGGKVVELNLGQGVVRPPDQVSDKAFFWLFLTLTLAENLKDPYE